MKPRSGPPMPSFARTIGACVLAAVALLVAGCGKEAPKAVASAPVEVTALTVAPRDVPITHDLRRADAELAGRQHPGARVGLPRQARLHRRRGGQGGPGAVPDGPEAVPGAGRRRGRGVAAQPGRAAKSRRPTSRAPSRSRSRTRCRRRTSTTRRASTSRRPPPSRSRRRSSSRPSSTSRTRRSPRRSTASAASPRWPTAPTSTPQNSAADDGVGADADVDQLQPVGERDGAHPQRGPEGASSGCPKAASSSSRSSWSTARCSRTRAGSPSPTRRTTRRPARS